ncbi:solute carrier family 12 member 8 [Protopterus annectens]|uniref:solute carrier family 12 member 8 n=1 Tax=Protopterus annectens TaxID=7888 RepID=UPI001CFBA02A|nr:solute carrier family 12 member 8 [Protopterus annectens]
MAGNLGTGGNIFYRQEVEDKSVLLHDSGWQKGEVKELFHEDSQVSQTQTRPWWKVQFFVWEPVLFGTWDGVFTSCMINIFGVVLFLRTGWLVGNTGVLLGMFLVSLVVLVALVTVFSGIGICEQCSIGSGGVYSMISTVLGGRVGGTIGFIYIFGQCVGGAMYVTGFAESIAQLLNFTNIWVVRGISIGVLLGLLGINLAGVKWIIRLQLLLLALLAISTLDFVLGTFTKLDPDHGFVGYSEDLLYNNTFPDYTLGESFFTVFGVFFPAATGVMAGFNMSGDLQKPAKSIPVGSLAAIGISWFLYLVFVFLLGAICSREALRYDFMIAEKVSLVGFLFLLGLYISSLASCMGGLYGAPRILQCIAQEKVIPILGFLAHGKGPNKTPVAAICLTSLVTMAFIFIGQVNVLAPIVTINFMVTYVVVDYAYFSVVMSYNLQQKKKQLRRECSLSLTPSKPLIAAKTSVYGTTGVMQARMNGTLQEFAKDMDQIFTPISLSTVSDEASSEKGKDTNPKENMRRPRKAAKQTLSSSFKLNLSSDPSMKEDGQNLINEAVEGGEQQNGNAVQGFHPTGGQGSMYMKQRHHSEIVAQFEQQLIRTNSTEESKHEDSEIKQHEEQKIHKMPSSCYSKLCNHWVSFIGAICSIVIMFVIQWIYALANIGVAIILYFYIGRASPGLPLGVAASFSFFQWIKSLLKELCRRGPSPQEQIVVTPSFATVGMETTQLTEENADFASRDRYHHSSVITREEFLNHIK